MIEQIIEQIINELGATGVLVLGLYFLLYRPLKKTAENIHTINATLDHIHLIIKNSQKQHSDIYS